MTKYIYVSPKGRDYWPGTAEKPVMTWKEGLDRANGKHLSLWGKFKRWLFWKLGIPGYRRIKVLGKTYEMTTRLK